MMCSRCKKRPAVVFIATMNGETKNNQGLCLPCAREIGLPQVDEYLKKIGLTDEEFQKAFNEMFGPNGMIADDDFDYHNAIESQQSPSQNNDENSEDVFGNVEEDNIDSDGELFEQGGANTVLPNIFRNILSNNSNSVFPQNVNNQANNAGRNNERKDNKKDRKFKFLDTFCTNLTKRAAEGKMDRIIGREKEINRVIQILSRRTKNNPCLIGEPGVGKTAIAEGIAQRLITGNVPFRLKDKQLYMLDLTALVAGTQFRGQFESRVKALIDEVKTAGNVILFIDEVHNLVGTGDNEGTMNMANIFKPALSRGELQVIGATTFNEYRKYIEKDSALERRFQPVTVTEPTIEETVELLKGIKEYYEQYHNIRISDSILKVCAVLSERYITDRFLPDKAIDLLDEAATNASIKNKCINEYEDMRKKDLEISDELSELTTKASVIDYEKIAGLRVDQAKIEERVNELSKEMLTIEVKEEDVCEVIELWTGIPASKLMETEFMKINKLESVLKSKIIGQDEACHLVASAVKRARVHLSARRRPASFIFVGPTGVGKTELVKVLANELFNSVDPLIRLDMSEYMEKYSVSKIIGSPPGYVGYDEAGQLTERVRRKPYSVILFDEIEKAHPDVMNILLQILDEGKITDSHGRIVNFENTVIAMTSNVGSSDNSTGLGFGKTVNEISEEKVIKSLREFLRPEFIGRVDEIVIFNPLTKENYKDIAKLMINEMREPLQEKNIELEIDDSALSCIAEKSFGGKYGGRDIRKNIRKEIEDRVADLIISSGDNKINKILVKSENGEIVLS